MLLVLPSPPGRGRRPVPRVVVVRQRPRQLERPLAADAAAAAGRAAAGEGESRLWRLTGGEENGEKEDEEEASWASNRREKINKEI
jgi:hypothetical protein